MQHAFMFLITSMFLKDKYNNCSSRIKCEKVYVRVLIVLEIEPASVNYYVHTRRDLTNENRSITWQTE